MNFVDDVCGFDTHRGSAELQQVRLLVVRFSLRRLRFSLRTHTSVLLYWGLVIIKRISHPSRRPQEAFKRAPRSLRGASLLEGFAKPPRRLDEPFAEVYEPFAEVYEPFAEVAYTEGSTKTPWRVHAASSKGPWMNSRVFLLDDACNRVWSILYCFFTPYATNIGEPILIPLTVLPDATHFVERCRHASVFSPAHSGHRVGNRRHRGPTVGEESPYLQCASAYAIVQSPKRPMNPSTRNPQHTRSASHELGPRGQLV